MTATKQNSASVRVFLAMLYITLGDLDGYPSAWARRWRRKRKADIKLVRFMTRDLRRHGVRVGRYAELRRGRVL